MDIFTIEYWIGLVIQFSLLAVSIFALVNCLLYSAASYEAAGKLNKNAWMLILVLALLVELFGAIGAFSSILSIAAICAPLIYLADVRPAVSGLYRR